MDSGESSSVSSTDDSMPSLRSSTPQLTVRYALADITNTYRTGRQGHRLLVDLPLFVPAERPHIFVDDIYIEPVGRPIIHYGWSNRFGYMQLTIDADIRPNIENADVFGWIQDIVARHNERTIPEVNYDADSSSSSSSSEHEHTAQGDEEPTLWIVHYDAALDSPTSSSSSSSDDNTRTSGEYTVQEDAEPLPGTDGSSSDGYTGMRDGQDSTPETLEQARSEPNIEIVEAQNISLLVGFRGNEQGDGPVTVSGFLDDVPVMILIDSGNDFNCIDREFAQRLRDEGCKALM